jgi:erythronate-4-phosphate dehydrogenase
MGRTGHIGKIVADSDIPFLRGVLEPFAEVRYVRGSEIGRQDAADARVLTVRTRTRCDERLLSGSTVETICTVTVGFDHIDMEYCRSRGIRVETSAGCNARAVLQWVAAALAWLLRERRMRPEEFALGVVGAGHVGSQVERYARAWGFRVLRCDPPRARAEGVDGFVPLDELARNSDIITFHTPLNMGGADNTFHLADERFFGLLHPDAVILNASRGEVVDSRALLASGRGYILDTWEGEPFVGRATVGGALLATPHIAGYSVQGKAAATAMSVDALAAIYDLPLRGWYPADASPPPARRLIPWSELCDTIGDYFDIEALSRRLKASPENFEAMRNRYRYRDEYF